MLLVVVFVPGYIRVHHTGDAVIFVMADATSGKDEIAGTAEVIDGEPMTPAACQEEGDLPAKKGDYIICKKFQYKRKWGATKVLNCQHLHLLHESIVNVYFVMLSWQSAMCTR